MQESPKNTTAETKEAPKKPFLLVYRDNDLFRQYAPVIEALLKARGLEVNIHSFPAGTPEEEIKNWYLEHKIDQAIESRNVLADNTTKKSTEYKLGSVLRADLDSVMRAAATEAVTGDATFADKLREEMYKAYNPYKLSPEELQELPKKQLELKQKYLAVLEEMYQKILISIPEEHRQKMEVVIIEGLFRGHHVAPSLIAHESFASKNFEELSKETDEFADNMKEWFKKTGITNITMFNTCAEIPPETINKLIDGRAYIIFDRHTSTPSDNLTREGVADMRAFWGANVEHASLIKERSALQTPVETFYSDVQNKIGIAANPAKVKWAVKRILQEELAKANL